MNIRNTINISILLIASGCAQDTDLISPDGDIAVGFSLDGHGIPQYAVSADGQNVFGISSMGLEALEANLCDGFEIVKVRRSKADIEWTQPWGENKQMRDRHNEMAVLLRNAEGTELTVRFKIGRAHV